MIKVALGLDIADFQAKLKAAQKAASSMGKNVASAFSAAFAPAAATFAAAAAVVGSAAVGMYKAMSEGGELVDLQERTGVAIETLMALKVGFEQAGVGADEVGPTINKLQKQIAEAAAGNQQAATTFDLLGVSLADLVKMSPDKQLEAIGEAIKKVEDPAKKAQMAMEVFGKSGGKLLALFAAGGLDDAAAALGDQARLMAQNAGIFDKITDTLGTATVKLQGFFVGMASAIAPQLLEAVDMFQNIDLSGIGAQIGSIVAVLINALQSEEGWTAVGKALQTVMLFGVNVLFEGLNAAFAAAIQILIEGFSILTKMDFWQALLVLLVGIAQKFGATILSFIPGMGSEAKALKAESAQNIEAASTVMGEQANPAEALKRVGQVAFGALNLGDSIGALQEKLGGVFKPFAAQADEAAAAAREKYAIDKKSGGEGLAIVPQMKGAGEGLVSSLVKIGGAVGGAAGGADPQLDQLRQQTSALQSMLGKLDQLIAVGQSEGAPGGAMVLA